jgi:hypothetical protein
LFINIYFWKQQVPEIVDLRRYENYTNYASEETIARILHEDEMALDYLDAIAQAVFPSISNTNRTNSEDSCLAPRGCRGYPSTGAMASRYTSPQHDEGHEDPWWTWGINLFRGKSLQHSEYYFCLSALDGGRGLIVKNEPGATMFWRGMKDIHGTVIGPGTNLLTKKKNRFSRLCDPDDSSASIGVAIYLKKGPLTFGKNHRCGKPQAYHAQMCDIELEHAKWALSYCPQSLVKCLTD